MSRQSPEVAVPMLQEQVEQLQKLVADLQRSAKAMGEEIARLLASERGLSEQVAEMRLTLDRVRKF